MLERWTPVGLVVAVLIVTDLLLINQSAMVTVPIACASAGLLLAIARSSGLSWSDVGLGRASLARGARWGAIAALLVAAGYAVILVSPFAEELLSDERTPDSVGAMLLMAFVVIPLRTVLLEEVAFRGVLWGMLQRQHSPATATAWSSVAFGLWHLPAAFLVIDSSAALSDATGSSGVATAAVVVSIVVVTGLTGVVLAELRRRSGSLLAAAGLHAGMNVTGTMASFLV
ncbi:CPBP family intramembrane glutamic endopeptidase [Aeromicrobium sp.]|uniref:CPBP family intramembrane glutamic endopeptidase n=1 Tax=Aeromicrobium sp. TaxID=1871063 RepID=UPI003D6BD1B1